MSCRLFCPWRRMGGRHFSLMMKALSMQSVMNSERLLNATKWIEATPGTAAKQAIDEKHIDALSKRFARCAMRLGYEDLEERVQGSLRRVKDQKNEDRFARLTAELSNVFGDKVVGTHWQSGSARLSSSVGTPRMVQSCPKRGGVAALFKATHAAECFAYLLPIKDLPMTKEGMRRAASSELVEHCKLHERLAS